jgi:hypothetical protein
LAFIILFAPKNTNYKKKKTTNTTIRTQTKTGRKCKQKKKNTTRKRMHTLEEIVFSRKPLVFLHF